VFGFGSVISSREEAKEQSAAVELTLCVFVSRVVRRRSGLYCLVFLCQSSFLLYLFIGQSRNSVLVCFTRSLNFDTFYLTNDLV